jgi:hypothetical protein
MIHVAESSDHLCITRTKILNVLLVVRKRQSMKTYIIMGVLGESYIINYPFDDPRRVK